MDEDIRVGDVVLPTGGGFGMTVEEVNYDNAVCVWFVRDEVQRETFKLSALFIPNLFRK